MKHCPPTQKNEGNILKFNPVIIEYCNVFLDDDPHAANKMLSCISETGISLIGSSR